ncbi:TIGR03085 family metal-binding protein [Cellulomonas massiliensis]|uniref:TIGR03085 family metal-binding protein n=1 Tax=Cellulomonas massiliensis TaxID=1465811 RepID=UPI00030E1B6E|nr:TIGR03085 family metal-binding protein [Cellulomonas massiliensis]
MTWHQALRRELVDALAAVPPDAPTLCEGWQARHLAAHVVLRQTSPAVGLGLLLPRVTSLADRRVEQLAATVTDDAAYRALVARVAKRPPAWHPTAWAGDAADSVELFVHTEDVRRGAGAADPRPLDAGLSDHLWRSLVRMAPLRLRGVHAGVVLVREDEVRARVRRPRGEGTAVVRGEVSELLLHLTGRGTAADVHVEGPGADALTAALPV